MPDFENAPIAVFNRGIIDTRALGRVDIKRVAISAEIQKNWMPRQLGSMTFRPGLEYVGGQLNNLEAKYIKFNRSLSDTAIIEMTSGTMRVRVDEQIITRPSVSTAVANGTLTTDLTSWSDSDDAGCTSQWVTGGYLGLTGNKFGSAKRRQTLTIAPADVEELHGLKVIINRGPVELFVGSTAGGEEYFHVTCRTGELSLAFIPTGTSVFLQFSSETEYEVLVDSIAVEAAGDMTLTAPWSVNDLDNLRFDQSNDVIFVASDGYQPRRIERWGTNSWALVLYDTNDGPVGSLNVSGTTMTSSVLKGGGNLTASNPYFNTKHVGAIFRLHSAGQKVSRAVVGEDEFTDAIRVTGVGVGRVFDLDITGTFTATFTLQRSLDDEATWTDITTYTTTRDTTYNDGLDNEIIFYRIGVKTGDWTSGTPTATLEWQGGSTIGHCRCTAFTSTTVMVMVVLDRMGQTTSALNWAEGIWSDLRGWPQALHFYEGRLWLSGHANITGSVSDAYASFNDQISGDSVAIIRSLAEGSVDFINWVLGMPNRLMVGTASSEITIRPKSPDEIITATTFNAKIASNQGSERVQAERVDIQAVYVDASGFGVNALEFDVVGNEYSSDDLTVLNPDIGDPGFVRMAVQRRPDTRVHCVRSDGTVAVLLFNPAEEINVWIEVETGDADGVNGVIEDAFVLPGSQEDVVYYSVKRVIDGVDVRYLEKWSLESECIGGTYNTQGDCFRMFINNPASATISGYEHLKGETVVVWADGKCLDDASGDIQTFTVDSNGDVTLTDGGSAYEASQGMCGLQYDARFKSGILPYAASNTALGQYQSLDNISLMLENTHHKGIQFGDNFTTMDDLPAVIDGATVTTDTIHSFLVIPALTFPGDTIPNPRLYLKANAPRPATALAAILGITTNEKTP